MVIALNRLILSYYLCIINIYGGDSMKINTKNIVSITEANQNFSKVARLVDEKGLAVILKNNVPRYLVLEFNSVENEQNAEDEDVIEISKRLMKKNKQAYEVLAK
jgi:antitoxin Phd